MGTSNTYYNTHIILSTCVSTEICSHEFRYTTRDHDILLRRITAANTSRLCARNKNQSRCYNIYVLFAVI